MGILYETVWICNSNFHFLINYYTYSKYTLSDYFFKGQKKKKPTEINGNVTYVGKEI